MRDQIRANAEPLATPHGLAIESIERLDDCRTEERIAEILARRGDHGSLMPVEYALDIVFRSAEALAPIYEEISRQAMRAVRAGDGARFLGTRLSPEPRGGATFARCAKAPASAPRWEGTR